MHLKFTIAVLSLFVVLKLTKTKYISKSTDDVYNERSEILTSAAADEAESTSEPFSDDPTSTKSNGIIEPEISWKDYFKNLNKTNGEADESKGFWPFFPYIVFAVVVLGLVYVVKMFLDFMKFCAKFYQKLPPKFASKQIQTCDVEFVKSSNIQTNL